MIIALELDKIICTPVSNWNALDQVEKCKVLPGAKEALDKLKELNHTILIYSKRDISLGMDTEVWLQKNNIKYDKIIFGKPQYDVMLDIQAFKFTDWDNFLHQYKFVLETR